MNNPLINESTLPVERTQASRLEAVDFQNLVFGSVFSDHMLVADYDGENWHARIQPYGPLQLSPSFSGLHYGQSIFEGMKAYRTAKGNVAIFRPDAHHARLNRSAERLCMPQIPEELFMQGLQQLLSLDGDWTGPEVGGQLYIRPIYFATDSYLGVRPSQTYRLIIFTCPVNAYYTEPVNVFVEETEVRAAPGGVGNAKMAGNYARTMKIGRKKKAEGYHVVLWLDANVHQFVEEYSTMNAFFVADGTVITPKLKGTILEGITRNSALKLLRDNGYPVEERDLSIEELLSLHKENKLSEAFGTGTAAVVSPVAKIQYRDTTITFTNPGEWPVANFIKTRLTDIRKGLAEDPYGWMHTV